MSCMIARDCVLATFSTKTWPADQSERKQLVGNRLVTLGTDGSGRSDNREHLRRHFEVNAESIVAAALFRLARDGG